MRRVRRDRLKVSETQAVVVKYPFCCVFEMMLSILTMKDVKSLLSAAGEGPTQGLAAGGPRVFVLQCWWKHVTLLAFTSHQQSTLVSFNHDHGRSLTS